MAETRHTAGIVRLWGLTQVTTQSEDLIAEATIERGLEEAKANAARIVLCWNSHDALVKALEATICGGCHNRIGYNPEDWDPTCDLCRLARLALASAKETA